MTTDMHLLSLLAFVFKPGFQDSDGKCTSVLRVVYSIPLTPFEYELVPPGNASPTTWNALLRILQIPGRKSGCNYESHVDECVTIVCWCDILPSYLRTTECPGWDTWGWRSWPLRVGSYPCSHTCKTIEPLARWEMADTTRGGRIPSKYSSSELRIKVSI